MAIRTIYENVKSDFYAVERSGYTTVSGAVYDTVTDLLNHGFTLSSVVYTDSNGLITTGAWPISETLYKLVAPGVGYKATDIIEMEGGEYQTNPLSLVVDSVNATGGIVTYHITSTGDYDVPPASPVPMIYPAASTNFVGTITAGAAVDDGGNNVSILSSIAPPYMAIPSAPGSTGPDAKHPYIGTGEMGDWPTATYLATRQLNVLWATTSSINTTLVKVGQEIYGEGIPTGTVITAIRTFSRITGVSGPIAPYISFEGSNWWTWRDTSVVVTAIIVSNPITVEAAAVLHTRGVGATFDNTEITTPSKWTAIVEAGATVDPMNDDVGVYANVATTTIDSIYVEVEDLVGIKIYPGHLVVSTLEIGSITGITTVVAVTANSITNISNVTLSLSQTLGIAGEQLHFIFPELQPWRLALDVYSDQQVAVYAATPLQLTDTGNIARVTNENGEIVDTAGAMGSQPTGSLSPPIPAASVMPGKVYSISRIKDPASATSQATSFSSLVETLDGAISSVSGDKPGQFFTCITPKPNSITGTGEVLKMDGSPWSGDSSQGFVNRTIRVGAYPQAYPLNYAVTITDHGLFFGMWEGTWSTLQRTLNAKKDNYFNWLVIQRPVDRFTGDTLTTGRAPVFCINSVGYKYWKFIVREADILHPSQGDPMVKSSMYDAVTKAPLLQTTYYRVPADQHSEDSFAVLNTSNQIALTEDSKYLVGFLHNLTTPRFRYSEEIDMIGQTSADVCMSSNDISLTTYNESGPRLYRAMPSNNKYNSGLRICILKDTAN